VGREAIIGTGSPPAAKPLAGLNFNRFLLQPRAVGNFAMVADPAP